MLTLEQTIALVAHAHRNQVDKAGDPYILHPLRVMLLVEGDYDAMILALLHDVVEDTDVTLADLSPHYPERILEALSAITHPKHEPLTDYYNRILNNALAHKVKLYDIKANNDRLELIPDQATRLRLITKYIKALEVLDP